MRALAFAVLVSVVLPLFGCVGSLEMPDLTPRIREFTARDALEVLGLPRMANAATLDAKVAELRYSLLPQIAESLSLVRAGEAVSKGATAKGVTVFVIDDFSFYKFKDGRYHGDYVSALIKIIAPDATVLTCDAWKSDLGECLFDANHLASQSKIHVVNMSLGIVGTYCQFIGTSFEDDHSVLPDQELPNDPFEPHLFMEPTQSDALEHWVRDLRAKGVTVISSAGNDGYKNAAKAPGCWSSLAAGAVYDAHFDKIEWRACTDENVNADDRTCWSNYGQVFF